MSTVEYALGLALVVLAIACAVATPYLLVHARSEHDHGPACWWCHPRLRRR
ncbi:hypothetical protein P3T36_006343 [Kitasatospora sp. MAP12-15]|uniref:hypothetical protein n=1 Tax=unclassified Kitasatospora TaxID=2633591 RepID=UPI0024768702|nr:hypothetical protein [Kitasatospora sp. MAP12-44]MDH6107884.1 hypothetical protein [Kitasatospora sp. MAP12-44]